MKPFSFCLLYFTIFASVRVTQTSKAMQTTAIRTVANSLPENEVILLTLLISKRYIPLYRFMENLWNIRQISADKSIKSYMSYVICAALCHDKFVFSESPCYFLHIINKLAGMITVGHSMAHKN